MIASPASVTGATARTRPSQREYVRTSIADCLVARLSAWYTADLVFCCPRPRSREEPASKTNSMLRSTGSATSVDSTPRALGKRSAVALRIVAGVIASGIASSSCHQHMHCASSHEATTLEHVCDSYINGACVGYGDQPRTETVCDRWECDDPTGKNCSGNCANKSAVSSGGGPNLTFRYAGSGCTCPAVLAPGVPSGGPCRESADCAETCCTCGSGSQHDAFTSRVCLDGHCVGAPAACESADPSSFSLASFCP